MSPIDEKVLTDSLATIEKAVEKMPELEKAVADIKAASTEKDGKIAELEKSVKDVTDEFVKIKSVNFSGGELSKEAKDKKLVDDWKKIFKGSKSLTDSVNETNDSEGGYAIPEEYASEIIDNVARHGIVRPMARIIPMMTDTLKMTSVSGITAYVTKEGSEMSKSRGTYGRITFNAMNITVRIPISNNWMEDVRPEHVRFIMDLASEALAYREDYLVLAADGTDDETNGAKTGLLNNSSIGSVTMDSGSTDIADLTWANISDLMASVTRQQIVNPLFVFNQTVRGVLRKAEDTAEYGMVFKPSGDDVNRLWGKPFVESDIMPGTSYSGQAGLPFAVYGDFKQLGIGDRRRVTIQTNPYENMGSGETYIYVTMRADYQVLDNNAFGRLITASV